MMWNSKKQSITPRTLTCDMRLSKREESLLQDSHQKGKKMIMIVKTPGSQMGSPAAAEEGGEEMG